MDARHFDALKKLCGSLDAASLARMNFRARAQLEQYPEGREALRYGGGNNTVAYTAALILLVFFLYTFIGKRSRGDDGSDVSDAKYDINDIDVSDAKYDINDDDRAWATVMSVAPAPARASPKPAARASSKPAARASPKPAPPAASKPAARASPKPAPPVAPKPAPENYFRCNAEVPNREPSTLEPFIRTFDIKPGTLLIIDPAGLAFDKDYESFQGCGGVSNALYRIFSLDLYAKHNLGSMEPGEVKPHPKVWSPTANYGAVGFYAPVPAGEGRTVIKLLHAMCPDGRPGQFTQPGAFYAKLEEVMNNIGEVIRGLSLLPDTQPLQVWIPNLSGGVFLGVHSHSEYTRAFTKLVYDLCKKHPNVVFKHNVYVKDAAQQVKK